jgi:hypothetical protein
LKGEIEELKVLRVADSKEVRQAKYRVTYFEDQNITLEHNLKEKQDDLDILIVLRHQLEDKIEEFSTTFPSLETVRCINDALASYDFWANDAINLFRDLKSMVEDVFTCQRCHNFSKAGK